MFCTNIATLAAAKGSFLKLLPQQPYLSKQQNTLFRDYYVKNIFKIEQFLHEICLPPVLSFLHGTYCTYRGRLTTRFCCQTRPETRPTYATSENRLPYSGLCLNLKNRRRKRKVKERKRKRKRDWDFNAFEVTRVNSFILDRGDQHGDTKMK